MEFKYTVNEQLPPLAWLSVFTKNSNEIKVHCGSAVETFDDYFVAGVWDGLLDKGDFDNCHYPCCTGLKMNVKGELGGVILVTPLHLQESVFSLKLKDELYLSNSLSFVLEASDSDLLPSYKQYIADMGSVLYGINSPRLVRSSPLKDGRKVCYHRCCIARIDKDLNVIEQHRRSGLDFKNFEDYKKKTLDVLSCINANATDKKRKCSYGMITTISRGYDAPTASAFAASVGCNEAFTFYDKPDDDGTEIAKALGYEKIHRGHSKAFIKNSSFLEAEALASGETGSTFIAFEELYRNKILIIGSRGDSVYERLHGNVNDYFDFHEGNQLSQTSLTIYENMLKNNSITLSVPLIGADRWSDMARISNSEEMKAFSIGDDYDRPIARRILEEAGVKRPMFGQRKFGAGVSYSLDNFYSIKQKMSAKSYQALTAYKESYPCDLWADIKYQFYFYWMNRSIYINYLLSKIGLHFKIHAKGNKVGMIANPYSTMMLHWGISMIRKRYKVI